MCGICGHHPWVPVIASWLLQVVGFWADWAMANFGDAAGPAAAEIFSRYVTGASGCVSHALQGIPTAPTRAASPPAVGSIDVVLRDKTLVATRVVL